MDGGHTVFTVLALAFIKPEIDFVLKLLLCEEASFLELREAGRCPIDRFFSILQQEVRIEMKYPIDFLLDFRIIRKGPAIPLKPYQSFTIPLPGVDIQPNIPSQTAAISFVCVTTTKHVHEAQIIVLVILGR